MIVKRCYGCKHKYEVLRTEFNKQFVIWDNSILF